jgi:hypothetical protein
MPKIFPHILITRYGIGVSSADWYTYKARLFRSITLPSIASQSREKFFWMIVIDSAIPPASLAELSQAIQPYSFIHLVTLDTRDQPRMVHGGFSGIYERCQQYLLARGLIEDPTDYVITSLIDDDDAWNRNVVSRIDRHVEEHSARLCATESDSNRGFLIRHSVGLFMTFTNGILWDVASNRFQQVKQHPHSMSVFVFARFSSNVAACSVRHGSWHNYTSCVGFESHVIDEADVEGQPMWIYLRHPRAISQIPGPSTGDLVDVSMLERFRSFFAIDTVALAEYKKSIETKGEHHSGSPDEAKFELLDLQFRIAAYRKQIECLSTELINWPVQGLTEEFLRLQYLKNSAVEKLSGLTSRFSSVSALQS